jgi:hypothetical protein
MKVAGAIQIVARIVYPTPKDSFGGELNGRQFELPLFIIFLSPYVVNIIAPSLIIII